MTIINKAKEIIKSKYNFFFDERTPMEEKNFYIVMLASIPIFFILALVFMYRNMDKIIISYSIVMVMFIFIITHLARMTENVRLYGTIYCIILNFLINPLYFFVSGDIFNGVTIFFTLSVIITVFLHSDNAVLFPLFILEILYDIGIIIYTYLNKELFLTTRVNMNFTNAVTTCFTIVAISVAFMCLYQTYIFNIAKIKLDEANRDISIAESSKTRFLANMTHEIRTPMNAIIGMTNLILKEDLDDDIREQINIVKTASTDLLRIINDILEFSKIDSGKVELINVEYSFSKLIATIIDSIAREYEKDNISLNVFVSSKIPDVIFGDDVRIRQIFNYILFSSLSRTPYGNVFIDIDGNVDDFEKTVTISCKISSTGSGFSTSELSSMFNAYSDYDSRQKSAYKGMGLELNICKAMLELMNGNMDVQSIEGVGTSVSFTFTNYMIKEDKIAEISERNLFKPLVYETNKAHEYPWQKLFEDFGISAAYARNSSGFKTIIENTRFSHIFVDKHDYAELKTLLIAFECEDITYVISDYHSSYGDFGKCKILRAPLYSINLIDAINDSWNEEDYIKEKAKDVYVYPGARILVVDDSSINLKVLESLLSAYEIQPRLAQSGYEALDILKREEFDMILLDQKMPEFDGIDTIHALRNSDYINSDVPAICVTAEFGVETKNRLIAEGFDDYLAKPINIVYLDRVINEYLPEELRVIKEMEDSNVPEEKGQQNIVEDDAPEFDPNIGIANLGGSKEAYIEVLSEYYKEGLDKLEAVPKQFISGDISLYTTNVHALKSSSATVGAMRVSPMFKALEFAGKDNNKDFIAENSDKTFEIFKGVLELVKEYLISENAFPEEKEEDLEDLGEAESINPDELNELLTCILSMNLRRSEEIINSLISKNYGSELNKKIKEIKNNFDGFEYMEVKSIIESVLN